MQLWQLDTIAVDDKEKALIALCEEQESIIEGLRHSLSEAEKERDDAEYERDDMEGQLEKMEKERDAALEKLEAVEAIVDKLKILFV